MEGENDEMGKTISSSSSHRSSSSPKVEKIKKIGDVSEKDEKKELRNFKLSPSIRPGVLSKVPSSGSFDKNIDDGSDESSILRKGEKSPKTQIRKKKRTIDSEDDEKDHGEGISDPSQDGTSSNPTEHHGNVIVKEKGNKAKAGGSSTEKAQIDPLSQAPKPKSASGSQNRRDWTPNPV